MSCPRCGRFDQASYQKRRIIGDIDIQYRVRQVDSETIAKIECLVFLAEREFVYTYSRFDLTPGDTSSLIPPSYCADSYTPGAQCIVQKSQSAPLFRQRSFSHGKPSPLPRRYVAYTQAVIRTYMKKTKHRDADGRP